MAILVTNAVQIARFANALYGIKLGSATNAAVMEDISNVGLTSAVNSYYTSSFGSSTNAAVATSILGNLGLADNAAAQAYVEGQLNAAGSAKGAAVLSMLNAFSNMTADATFGAAATAWNEKIVAARAYTVANTADVTTDYSAPVTGQTFTLTTSADNSVGGAGDDTFSAQVNLTTTAQSTFTAGDVITGGSGTDTLSITAEGLEGTNATGWTLAAASATGVEVIKVRNLTDEVVSVNADNFTGETTLVNDRSTAAVTFTNIGSADVTVIGDGSSTIGTTTIDVGATSVTDALTLNLQDGTKGTGNITFADTEADWTSATINSTGAANTVGTIGLTNQSSVTSLTINAAKGLTATAISGFKSTGATVTIAGATTANVSIGTIDSNITSVDASGLTAAGLTATTAGATASIVGGAGNDSITIGVDKTSGTTAMGDGFDTVSTTNNTYLGTAARGALVTGAEKLTINAAETVIDDASHTDRTQDVSYVSGITTIGVTGATVHADMADDQAKAITFTGLSAAVTSLTLDTLGVTDTSSINDLTTTITASRGTDTTADSITVTLGSASAESGVGQLSSDNDASLINLVLSDEESITISTVGAASVINSLSAGDATEITASGSKGLTIVGFTSAAVTSVNASAMTGAFVMGAAASDLASAITGGSGNDTLYGGTLADNILGGDGNDTIYAGAGNDTINSGSGTSSVDGAAGNDTIVGGSGNDSFEGGGGTDSLDGGAGNDSFAVDTASDFEIATAAETVIGGDGTDSIVYANGITMSLAASNLTAISGIETIQFLGDSESASVTLTDAVFTANGTSTLTLDMDTMSTGDLTVSASGLTAYNVVVDYDLTTAVNTASNIVLGAGNDTVKIDADSLNDAYTITGGAGTDTLMLTAATTAATQDLATSAITGFEVITFGNAAGVYAFTTEDTNISSGATLTISGGVLTTGTLLVDGSAETTGIFNITGGSGADSLTGGSGADTFVGGVGADSIIAGAGNDSVDGGDGADVTLDGGAGNDTIMGGAGADTIEGEAGIDYIDAGAGDDVIRVDATADFQSLTNVETVIGGSGNDTVQFVTGVGFTVTASDLAAVNGIETLQFLSATDATAITLADSVYTANGVATLTIDADSFTTANLTVSASTLSVGNNVIVDYDKTNAVNTDSSIVLGSGNDTVKIDADTLNDAFTVTGGSGTDTLMLTAATTAATQDLSTSAITGFEVITFGDAAGIYAFTTEDANISSGSTLTVSGASLTGTVLIDGALETNGYFVFNGGAGNDTFTGGSLADTISAGSGVDSITGGLGADSITGGAGNDVFVYANVSQSGGTAVDTITDWTSAADTLKVTLDYSTQSAALDVNAVLLGTGAATLSTIQDGLTGKRGEYQYNVETSQLVINFNNDNLITASDYKIGLSAASTSTGTVVDGDLNFSITGGAGADSIVAGAGADTLVGGSGADTIVGGNGNDYMTGGTEADVFRLDYANGADGDVISDFASGDYLDINVGTTTANTYFEGAIASVATTDEICIITAATYASLAAVYTAGTFAAATEVVVVYVTGAAAFVYYDSNGETTGGETLLATLTGVTTAAELTAAFASGAVTFY